MTRKPGRDAEKIGHIHLGEYKLHILDNSISCWYRVDVA